MKRLFSYLGVISFFTSIVAVHAANFADVPNDSWFKPYTDYLVSQEIVSNNAQFFPYRTITRAELAKMATNAGIKSGLLAAGDATSTQSFCDVPSTHWAHEYINILGHAQIVSGSSTTNCSLGKNFSPDRPITRAEAIKILLNLYHIAPGGSHNFYDVSTNLWYSPYIAAAVQAELVNGYNDGSFKPNNFLTRAEMSKVLVRTINHQNGQSNPPTIPSPSPSPTPPPPSTTNNQTNQTIKAGAITIYALGDSLTAGDGDETEQQGYTSRLLNSINSIRPGSHITDIGVSGVNSTTLVQDQLPRTISAHPDIVTVLIGSNDMWEDGWNDHDTSADTIQVYRDNMDQILSRLHTAGIKVFVGLVDDQSRRPVALGSGMGLNDTQRARMSRIATAFNQIIQEKATQYGATTVDFYHSTIFTNAATLSDDGNHPNAQGYAAMASLWFSAIRSQL